MNNVITTVDNHFCSGCGICSSVCQHKAITMQYNTIGNLHPKVNENCVNCGLCLKVCPGSTISKCLFETTDTDKFVGSILRTYIGRSLNPTIYNNSQSGGIVTSILSYLFYKNQIDAAIVARCDCGEQYPITDSVIIKSAEELHDTQKSIYTPVDILSRLKDVPKEQRVAIVGLPCQMEALYLAQQQGLFKNVIYKIGLICDRILSRNIYQALAPLSLRVALKIERKNGINAIPKKYKAYFRDKSHSSYKFANMAYDVADEGFSYLSPEPRHLLKDFYTHPRCRICFDKLNIFSDISCGDPWGMNNVDFQYGDSLIFARSPKGLAVLLEANQDSYILLQECDIETAIEKQFVNARKRRCFANIKVFEENNWQMPETYKLIQRDSPNSLNNLSFERRMVKLFLEHEKLNIDEILREAGKFMQWNKKRMKRNQFIHNIKTIVKRIIRRK